MALHPPCSLTFFVLEFWVGVRPLTTLTTQFPLPGVCKGFLTSYVHSPSRRELQCLPKCCKTFFDALIMKTPFTYISCVFKTGFGISNTFISIFSWKRMEFVMSSVIIKFRPTAGEGFQQRRVTFTCLERVLTQFLSFMTSSVLVHRNSRVVVRD